MTGFLDIDQLKTFVAICESGSFTRAAETVHKTQSAVSMQMRRLEERVGRPLFQRDGRQSKLTDDGGRLLFYARKLIRLNDETLAAFNEEDLVGRVRLGTPDDYAARFLPEILARFSHSHPRAEITVICARSKTLMEMIGNGELDVAIVTHVQSLGPAEVLRREPLLWVGSQRHAAHELEIMPLALSRPTCTWRIAALTALEAQGRAYRLFLQSGSMTAITAAVTSGLAVSVMPESALRGGMRILGEAQGLPALPRCEIGLIRGRTEPTAVAEALTGHIIDSLDNISARLAAE